MDIVGEFCQVQVKKHRITLVIAAKNRYAIEQTHEHFKKFRKLVIRYEKKPVITSVYSN
jgi:hypothetical protein